MAENTPGTVDDTGDDSATPEMEELRARSKRPLWASNILAFGRLGSIGRKKS